MNVESAKTGLLNILSSTEFASLQIDVSQINDDTSLVNDVGLDSLQLLELLVAIELTFNFKINVKRLNIDIFDRFESLVAFVSENGVAYGGTANA